MNFPQRLAASNVAVIFIVALQFPIAKTEPITLFAAISLGVWAGVFVLTGTKLNKKGD